MKLTVLQEPPLVREAMLYAELLMARSQSEAVVKSQVWVPANDDDLCVRLFACGSSMKLDKFVGKFAKILNCYQPHWNHLSLQLKIHWTYSSSMSYSHARKPFL